MMGSRMTARTRCGVGTRWRRLSIATVLAMATATLAVAGCGDSSSGGGGEANAASGGNDADAQQTLDQGFAGIVDEAPSTGPKAVPGKTVWMLSCLGFEGCQRSTNGFIDAAKELGWTVKSVDTKADPTKTIAAMRQAISAGADAIVEVPMDCPVLKSGLLAARAADVPVLTISGLDCDSPVFNGGEPLFAANVQFGGKDWADWKANLGKSDADFVLALAAQKGIKNPKIIQVRNDDQALQAAHAKAFEAEIKAKCAECTVYPLQFTIAQIGGGNGPQIYRSGVLAHPNADVLYYNFDSQLPLGLQAAIQGAGKDLDVVCCGDGSLQGNENLKAGISTASNAYPWDWSGWATADALNRVFAGETSFPPQGGEVLYVDKDHNLPPEGEYALGGYDYKAAYRKIWTGG